MPLADQLAEYVRVDSEQSPELEAALAAMLEKAREAWPNIELADGVFVRHVGERLVDAQADLVRRVASLHAADLYLACACSRGDEHAIAAFERAYVSQISAYLSRSDALPSFTDEVKQAVRERILVARDTVLPRIGSYNGRGPLGGWLRMVATRIAADLRRAQKQNGRPVENPTSLIAPDPEMVFLKQRYGPEFERAVETAFGRLDARSGNVLRLHFLDGLSPASIAAMYRVSARTVQRWIVAAERELLSSVRRIVTERLDLSPSELDSLLDLVRSQLCVSLSRS